MKKRTHSDREALEGLPLKLMIVLLLISLSFPIFINSYQQYESTLISEAVETELERLESKAMSAFLGGPGSKRTVDIHLPAGSDAQGISIEIGGKAGSAEARCFRYHIGDFCRRRYIDGLTLDISSPTGDAVVITSLGAKLTIEYLQNENCSWMEARIIS